MIKAFGSSNQALRSWYMFFFQLSFLPEQLVRRTLARTLRDSGLPETYIDGYVSAMAEPGEPQTRGGLTARLRGLEGRVFAKTGTLTNVAALSGYILREDGDVVVFSILTNASGLGASRVQTGIDEIVRALAR